MAGRLLIWGAGGHAACVFDAAVAAGWEVAAFVDDVTQDLPARLFEQPVLRSLPDGEDPVVIAVGDPKGRQAVAGKINRRSLATVIHPAACVSPLAEIAEGGVVLAGAVVGPRACLGRCSVVGANAVVDHDARLGSFATVSPGAVVAGWAELRERAFVGAGAAVRDRVTVGADGVVGMGAAVISDVPEATTVVGVPAEPLSGGRT